MEDQTILDREEQFAALTQLYLELRLPVQAAEKAARADLQFVIRPEVIAEAA